MPPSQSVQGGSVHNLGANTGTKNIGTFSSQNLTEYHQPGVAIDTEMMKNQR